MKVALIGASGQVGSRILGELLNRSHGVTAIVRHPEKVPAGAGVAVRKGDVFDRAGLVKLLAGHDAVVSSVKFKDSDPPSLIQAVREAGVKRYIVVGGAGSLEIAPGLCEVDGPNFPPHVRPEALRGADFLELL